MFLHDLIRDKDDLEDIQALIAAGADVDAYDEEGYTPLYYAIQMRRIDITKCLLEQGADINLPCREGGKSQPLAVAILARSAPRMLIALIDAGADVDAFDDDGYPPLFYACFGVFQDAFLARELVDAGADVRTRCDFGSGPSVLSLASSTHGSRHCASILRKAGAPCSV